MIVEGIEHLFKAKYSHLQTLQIVKLYGPEKNYRSTVRIWWVWTVDRKYEIGRCMSVYVAGKRVIFLCVWPEEVYLFCWCRWKGKFLWVCGWTKG